MAHAHRGFARATRARVERPGARLAGDLPRGIAQLGADFLDARRRRHRTRASTQQRELKQLLLRARVRGVLRRTRVRRQPRAHRLACHRLRGRRAAARLERRRGTECLTSTSSSSAPARAARPRPTCSPPRGSRSASSRRAATICSRSNRRTPASATSRATRSSSTAATSSDRIRCSSRARTGAPTADGDRLLRGRRATTCPRRSAARATTPTGSCRGCARSTSGSRPSTDRSTGADIADWPLDYDELEPFYAEAERLIGVAGDHTGNPFAAWRSGPYPMPPGADMFLTTLTVPAARGSRLPPVPCADRREQRPVRRPARVQQLRVLRVLRLPDRSQGRPDRAVAPRAADRSVRGPAREHRGRVVLDGTGRGARGVRYLDGDAVTSTSSPPTPSSIACGAFETPRLLLRSDIGNSSDRVGRYLMFHIQTIVLGVLRHAAARVQGTRRHPPHGRPDRRRRCEPPPRRLRRAPVPARRHRRARRWRPPDHGSDLHAARSPSTAPDGRVERSATHGRVHDAGRRSSAAHESGRPRSVAARRLAAAVRTGHVHLARARHRLRRALGAAPRRRSCSDAGARHAMLRHLARHPGLDRARPAAHLASLDGHRADGH